MRFAIKYSNPRVSGFATHFKIGSGGQELMMDFFYLFIYLFCLLANLRFVGFSSSCEIIRLQRTGTNGEGSKWILVVTFCVVSSSPPDFPVPSGVRHQRMRHRLLFVIGLLTGTLARGHLGTEQRIKFVFCVHCSAQLLESPGTQTCVVTFSQGLE